ncbi:MAG TPA: STAS domain-containing protein [Acidimicrobiales bacterium]|nr:STAS domain-containing protein [Acidimicrobiales bacterium]
MAGDEDLPDSEDFPDTGLLRVEAVGDRTGATVIAVGHLDEGSSGLLLDAVERVLATRPRAIAIDASGLTFVNSSGLAALLRARHAVMTEAGLAFRIVDPSPALRRTAELAGFERLLGAE